MKQILVVKNAVMVILREIRKNLRGFVRFFGWLLVAAGFIGMLFSVEAWNMAAAFLGAALVFIAWVTSPMKVTFTKRKKQCRK